MLKVCWDCLVGNRIDENDAAYDSRVNRDTSNAWYTSLQSENMFRLPRPLKIDDTITIRGIMNSSFRSKLLVNLVTGINQPDYGRVACQFEADFGNPDDSVKLNGIPGNFAVTDLFPGGVLKVSFTFRISSDDGAMTIYIDVGESAVGSIDLRDNLTDITFLTVNEGLKVEELQFVFT